MKSAKIAQRDKQEERLCRCGGRIVMVTLFRNGKLQPMARCERCGRERRKPSELYV